MPKIVAFSLMFSILALASFSHAEERSIANVRSDAARRAYEISVSDHAAGSGTVEAVYMWSLRWMLALGEPCASCLEPAVRAHRDRMRALAERARSMAAAGTATPFDVAASEYYAAEAEYWVSHGRGPLRRRR